LDKAGEMVGAVNTIRREADGRLIGNMFDGLGFVAGLRSQGHDPAGKKVLLLGAGGAAGAIAFALADSGVSLLSIANRTKEKAQKILGRIATSYPDLALQAAEPDPGGYDLIINSTSLGMNPEDPLPIAAPQNLAPGMIIADIIMKPETTLLLKTAKSRGCDIHYGRHMLDQQIKLMAAFMRVEEK
jgi:shikimate dehydrogenase